MNCLRFRPISKKLFITILVMITQLLQGSFTYSQWYQAYSHTPAQSCYALKFYDNNTGYHSGVLYNGSTLNIYKTTDGGNNWTSQNSGFTAQRFMAIEILHPDTVFICGNYGKILRTYNGGQNWITVYSDTNVQLWDIKFVSPDTGFVAGSSGTILKTTNKGDNWIALQSGISNALQGMYFLNSTTGFVSGSLIVLKTTDSGVSWTDLNAPGISFEINTDVYFINEMTGWFSTNSGRIVKTTNGGMNWNIVLQDVPVWRLSFTNDLTGYGCRSDGSVIKTTNGGDNWLIQTTPLTENLYDIDFTSGDTGYIATWSGKILKTNNGGGTPLSVNEAVSIYDPVYDLLQSYPNPFNPATRISFRLNESSAVKLTIYDATGMIVDELINANMNKGFQEITWNAEGRPSGIYFCRLSAASQDKTLKLVLVK